MIRQLRTMCRGVDLLLAAHIAPQKTEETLLLARQAAGAAGEDVLDRVQLPRSGHNGDLVRFGNDGFLVHITN